MKIIRESTIIESARVLQARGMFEIQPSPTSREEWTISADLDAKPWQIGLIVGPSGSGKSTIARELFGSKLIEGHQWDPARSILDGFPAGMGIKAIIEQLSSVGFSSPPAWLRPFGILSTGQQFRVTVARALAESPDVAVIDEFTSVVDRTVAQIGSAALAKAVRRSGKRFVAVACHYDILDWLQPDWVLDLGQPDADRPGYFALQWRSVQPRPTIALDLREVHHSAWAMFKAYHYMSGDINKSARCFIAFIEEAPIAFVAVLYFSHATAPGWRTHRSVCLPDFQGVGIGNKTRDAVASIYKGSGKPVRTSTANIAVVAHARRSPNWVVKNEMHLNPKAPKSRASSTFAAAATDRLTASLEYIGPADVETWKQLRRAWDDRK